MDRGRICALIGHWYKEKQPPELINSPHRRLSCRICGILRWRFVTETQEELDEIMNVATGTTGNRAQRRSKDPR